MTWKLQHYGCLNKTKTSTPLITRNGTSHGAHPLLKGARKLMTTERRSCLLRDESLVGYPVPVDQLWNGIHITNIIWTKRVVFIYLCIYIYAMSLREQERAGLASMRSASHDFIFCCHRRLKVNLSSLSRELYRQTLL